MGEFTNIQWTFHKEFVWFLYKISIAFCLTIKSPRAIWWKILYLSIMIAACSGSQQGHQLPKTWNVAASWPPECQYSMSGWCFDTIDSCVCVLCVSAAIDWLTVGWQRPWRVTVWWRHPPVSAAAAEHARRRQVIRLWWRQGKESTLSHWEVCPTSLFLVFSWFIFL